MPVFSCCLPRSTCFFVGGIPSGRRTTITYPKRVLAVCTMFGLKSLVRDSKSDLVVLAGVACRVRQNGCTITFAWAIAQLYEPRRIQMVRQTLPSLFGTPIWVCSDA